MGFEINIPGTIPTIEDFERSAPIGLSPLGTLLFDDITFPKGSYINRDGQKVEYTELKLLAAKVMVSQSKNIITTQIANRDGSVKQYVSLSDYNISISSKISELFNIFPADQLTAWQGLANVPENIEITSKLLNKYIAVDRVVIKDFSFSPLTGSLNEVALNMTLLSDVDIDFNRFLKK